MKKILGIVILLCLVFLNVPRQLVHSCDDHAHESHQKHAGHSDGDDHDVISEADQDACFYCDFDLGFFSTSEFLSLNKSKAFIVKPTEQCLAWLSSELNSSLQLRGPPARA